MSARTSFEEIDSEIQLLGSRLIHIGDALLQRPQHVSVCWPDKDVPPDVGADTWIGIEDELPTKVQIQHLLEQWHAARRQEMKHEIRGSEGMIACPTCGNTRFDIPSDETGDPLINCRCGHVLGPLFSLRGYSNNEAHTTVNAKLVKAP